MKEDFNYQDDEYFQDVATKLYGDLVLLCEYLAQDLDNTESFQEKLEDIALMQWAEPFIRAYREVNFN